MYGGHSGCYGMIIYNTGIKGDNAVYGYYEGSVMRFAAGTLDEMKEIKKAQESQVPGGKGVGNGKMMVGSFFGLLAAVIAGFIFLPLRISAALLVFAVLSYVPLMIVFAANRNCYGDERMVTSFRRFHGCEHAIISAMSRKEECTAEALMSGRFYDPECGTAYSGYALTFALEIALLIAFWPGLFKSLVVMALTVAVLLIMILVPRINPFVLIQKPVVLPPTERECALGVEIIKKLKEL